MSSEKWERQLEALFSVSAPTPAPDQAAQSARQPVTADVAPLGMPSSIPVRERAVPTAGGGINRRQLLDLLLPIGVVGEAAAVIALVVMVYRSAPASLRGSQFLFAAVIFVGMTLLLLFVQWLLARRLVDVERLVQKRNRQLGQAVAAVQRYQQQLGLTRPGGQAGRTR